MAEKKKKRRRTLWIVIGSFVVLLIAFRIALPSILLKFVNRQLAEIPGYRGHVEDIDVALIRGAYKINDLKLEKLNGKIPVPFFASKTIDLSIEWKALFKGKVVGEIVVERPVLNFVKGPTEATSQTKIDKKWTDVVDDLLPIKLNRLEINNGEIHYRDFHSSPKVDIYTKEVQIIAENLSNVNRNKDALPSTAVATAKVYGGTARLDMRLNALNEAATFDAKAELVSLDITHLNNFLQAYANIDAEKGVISIYTEAAAKNNRIIGYTKPIIKDLKVSNWKEDKKKPLKAAWETVVEAVAWVFKNHPEDQLATKASFEGNLKDPNVNVFYIIGQVLRNAFIQALYPALENSVNIGALDKDDDKDTPLKRAYDKAPFKNTESKKKKNKDGN